MRKELVASDWNGVLVEYPDEGKLWEYVGLSLLRDSALRIKDLKNGRTSALIKSLFKLKDLTNKYKAEKIGYDAIYDLYSKDVLHSADYYEILYLIGKFSQNKKTQGVLDKELLEIFYGLHWNNECRTGIISTGCKEGIQQILINSGDYPSFDFIEANDFQVKEGTIVKFTLDIFGNKGKRLEQVLKERRIDERKAVYIGDTPEDDGCFGIVSFPVLSKHAKPEYKEEFSRKYPKGFVIEPTLQSYGDLVVYIKSK